MKKQKAAYHELQRETTDECKKLGELFDDYDQRLIRVLEKLKRAKEQLNEPKPDSVQHNA